MKKKHHVSRDEGGLTWRALLSNVVNKQANSHSDFIHERKNSGSQRCPERGRSGNRVDRGRNFGGKWRPDV
jgi:hypothetical protein